MTARIPGRERAVAAGEWSSTAVMWERRWFQVVAAGRRVPREWSEAKDEIGMAEDLMVVEHDTVDQWVAYYREQIEKSRAIAASMDLDTRARGRTSSSATAVVLST